VPCKKKLKNKQIKQEEKNPSKLTVLLIIIPLLLFSSIFVTSAIIKNNLKKQLQSPNNLVSTSIYSTKAIASPTPPEKKPNNNKEDIAIELINGSGIDETSNEIKEYLESIGYEGISISDSHQDEEMISLIKVKKSNEDYLELFLNDLDKKIDNPNTETSLEEDYSYDISIIIGKDTIWNKEKIKVLH